LTTSTT